ncbi:arabinan endo-1,5-alpha-L-arabinosidase [Dysgonomonas sp. Marseille-P4677]|uniref:arabinan endo-1,5-alpha-L-arabinosidase n=1 Tax=Dysgonomonas sp. Marseille-P4677 TaxID=2364790 RepID=UPI0019149A92|nr:arabinan endo-1,5-alpha-L-arabinosidase [Dysgonomonas sp. Marseille-P4677]MBK5720960.1 arabinan endo-1,5-alpha-L-arabinosidase [Dysgonomonas sp. Marseille-P4677]
MKYYKWLCLLICCTLLLGACNDDDKDFGEQGVIIETPKILEIASSSVQLETTLLSAIDVILSKRGFCYSTTPDPNIYNSTIIGKGNETFTATIDGLLGNTTYYVRAFVSIYNGGIVYSPQIEVLTNEGTLDEQLAQYKAPTYADNYSDISAWDMRSQWNLANVHDPSVILAEDDYYYMYQTDASYGNVHTVDGHFHARRSKDLVNWEYLGGTMKNLPEWVLPKLNEIRKEMGLSESSGEGEFGFWAPCVRKVQNGLYRMYYSIVCPGLLNGDGTWGERAFIGMMENSDPANNSGWVDKGYVVTNASDKGLNFNIPANDWANCYYKWNAIDPSYIITAQNEHWLIYGSWHSGLVAMELNASTGMPKKALGLPWADGSVPSEYGQSIYTRKAGDRWQASEGPELIYNPETDYYYLFVAYDAVGVPYNTRVARSKSITGPYLGIDGANVSDGANILPVVTHPYKFANSNGWVGISHCAIFDDGKGNWYYSSQGRLPESVDNNIMMGHVRSIRWTKDGWPLVMPERYGAVPKVPITEEELIGNWEHIDMSYSYGKQKESSLMTLVSEHSVSDGTWKGSSWSYDTDKQILTVNGVELYLQREVDWEATPRTHTIVYAAYGSNNKTYWGKKTK